MQAEILLSVISDMQIIRQFFFSPHGNRNGVSVAHPDYPTFRFDINWHFFRLIRWA
jgi:hypothetical protein